MDDNDQETVAAPDAGDELELSGPGWVDLFPTSQSLEDLIEPFRSRIEAFIAALTDAGASVRVAATYRPDERAFLMHYAYLVAKNKLSPAEVPVHKNLAINWVHPTESESQQAAQQMVDGYGILYAPAYPSNHTGRTAVDMHIDWTGTLTVRDHDGNAVTISDAPNDGTHPHLARVGATYGVIKLTTDPPHWSENGH
jgi:hypothetical protein